MLLGKALDNYLSIRYLARFFRPAIIVFVPLPARGCLSCCRLLKLLKRCPALAILRDVFSLADNHSLRVSAFCLLCVLCVSLCCLAVACVLAAGLADERGDREGNGRYGVWAYGVKLEGCTVRDNKGGDYGEDGDGRIER